MIPVGPARPAGHHEPEGPDRDHRDRRPPGPHPLVDTSELFGSELRILAAIDFRDGTIIRWVDYWDAGPWRPAHDCPVQRRARTTLGDLVVRCAAGVQPSPPPLIVERRRVVTSCCRSTSLP